VINGGFEIWDLGLVFYQGLKLSWRSGKPLRLPFWVRQPQGFAATKN